VEPSFHRAILKASLGRNEQTTKATPKTKPSTKGKSKPEAILLERSSLATRSLEVSLDNADTVIEGAPLIRVLCECLGVRTAPFRALSFIVNASLLSLP